MKHKILSLIIVFSMLLVSFTSFAETPSFVRDDILEKHLNEKISNLNPSTLNKLKSLGFPEERIKYLSNKEIKEIVKNNYKFIGSSEDTIYLVLYKKDNNSNSDSYSCEKLENGSIYSAMIPISKQEEKKYFQNKETFIEGIVNNLENISKQRNISVYKITNGKKEESSLSNFKTKKSGGTTVTEHFDSGVLRFGINAYDMSTSTKIKKKLGMDFSWSDMPYTFSRDVMALSHTGVHVGITDYYDYDASMKAYFMNKWSSVDNMIDADPEGHGLSASIDLPTANKCYGRAYIVIGNVKRHVDEGNYFFMVAKYGHVTKGYKLNPSIGIGSVGFSPSSSTKYDESDQVSLNSIKTY
ncbi:MAG: hypothetical protein N4A68_06910 [Maledivibacter sp.]|nr:hypothetical protein [Maledivibacter sp.]